MEPLKAFGEGRQHSQIRYKNEETEKQSQDHIFEAWIMKHQD